jgi:hypothetical protein
MERGAYKSEEVRRSKNIAAAVSYPLYQAVKNRADQLDSTVSRYIERLLIKDLEQAGLEILDQEYVQ